MMQWFVDWLNRDLEKIAEPTRVSRIESAEKRLYLAQRLAERNIAKADQTSEFINLRPTWEQLIERADDD